MRSSHEPPAAPTRSEAFEGAVGETRPAPQVSKHDYLIDSVDAYGRRIDGYCFVVYLDASGAGQLLKDAVLTELTLDADGIAHRWRIFCPAHDGSLLADITVRETRILKCWGSPDAPRTRREYSIIPLVLDGSAQVTRAGKVAKLRAYGLAEYFNADLWAADKAAAPGVRSPL